MTNIAYHTVILNSLSPEIIRKAMVERYYSINNNASAVAREYGTKRQTVAKWVNRFEKDGIIGLKNHSCTPHTESIYKKSKEVEDMIITLVKKKRYRIGQDRVRLELPQTMHCSTATINRIMHTHDLIKKRRKKHQRKKQCAEYKKTLRALRNWQIDVKELRDIPNIVALVEVKIIPNFQYTARDQLTGTMFICYAWEHSLINSVRFVSALFEHLKMFGIHPGEITIQTDNGSEFIGNIFAKEDSGFTSLIEQIYHAKHITIPIGKKEYQGVVESSHGRIEYEFYDIETFYSLDMFLSKAYTYILYWNLDRQKISDKKSPLMLIKEKCGIFDTSIGDFKPFILDEVKTLACHYQWQGVPYVGDEVSASNHLK
jgi:transposase-like protein